MSQQTTPVEPQSNNFQDVADFVGQYSGSHDGRHARLDIELLMLHPHPLFLVQFFDVDRDEYYVVEHRQRETPPDGEHVLTDVHLENPDGPGSVTFRKLLLHTWNINRLTGISLWDGREFGACFRRVT